MPDQMPRRRKATRLTERLRAILGGTGDRKRRDKCEDTKKNRVANHHDLLGSKQELTQRIEDGIRFFAHHRMTAINCDSAHILERRSEFARRPRRRHDVARTEHNKRTTLYRGGGL